MLAEPNSDNSTTNTTKMSSKSNGNGKVEENSENGFQDLNSALQLLQKKLKNPQGSEKENLAEIQDQYNKLVEHINQTNNTNGSQQNGNGKQIQKPVFQEDLFEMNNVDMQQFQQQQAQQQQQMQFNNQQQQQFQQQQQPQQQNYVNNEQNENEPSLAELLQLQNEYDSEDEGIQDYKIGGYHTVHIGEVLLNRYVIIQKIGWGHFSTVWLAKDFKFNTYAALKIQKSAPHYLEAAYDEVEILQRVAKKCQEPQWLEKLKVYHKEEHKKYFNKNDCQVVQLLNSFVYKGPYGNHFCFVFEILGVNLLEVIKKYNYQGMPLHLARRIAKQCLIGLDFLHENCGVIHTDLKPENVLLQLTEQEIKDIVENGQMSNRKIFRDRLQYIRRKLGMQVDENSNDIDPSLQDLVNSQKDKKLGQQNQQQNNQKNSNDQSVISESTQPKEIVPGMSKQQRKNIKRKQKNKEKKKQAYEEKIQQQEEEQTTDNQNGEQEQEKQQNQDVQLTLAELFNKNLAKQKLQEQKDQKNKNQDQPIDINFNLKIADLGNACWNNHHFASEIQTRQYRSPEVIIEADYNQTADIWSLACMLFEMLTGDFLFEPRKGPNFSKNEDHLAQMQELIGKFDKYFSTRGKHSSRYFDAQGSLRKIPQLHFWPLKNVLVEKYKFKEEDALLFQDFMLNMLHPQPEKRATAKQLLNHPWLALDDKIEVKMNDDEHANYIKKRQRLQDLLGNEFNPINDDHFIKQGGRYDKDDRFDNLQNDGDKEDNSDDNYESDDEFYGEQPTVEMKLVDRSFTKYGYIGYGDGIDLNALDNTGNWQFDF